VRAPPVGPVRAMAALYSKNISMNVRTHLQYRFGAVVRTLAFLVEPIVAQLLVSVRRLQLWQGVDLLVGGAVLGWGLASLDRAVSLLAVVGFAGVFLLGVVMVYGLLLMLSASAFWFVQVDSVLEVFDAVFQAGRYPVGIYPGWLRILLSAVVPIGFAVTVPAEALTGRLTPITLLAMGGLAVAWLALARWCWRVGVRRYSGASA
jgi:ABC-2 type transport system permease protein